VVTVALQNQADVHVALTHAPIGAMIIDETGVISWANNAVAALLGEPDPSALRLSLAFVWLPQDDADILRKMLEVFFAAPVDARPSWTRVVSVKALEGIQQTVELTLTSSPGDFDKRAILYFQSLTRQTIAEKRFTQIFENLPLGALVVDGRQHIVQVNSALAGEFGYPREELVGQSLEVLLPPRYREPHSEHVSGYVQAPSSRIMGTGRDLTGLHRSGQEIPVEIALTTLENGAQPLFMAIVSDISSRKQGETALQQTNAQLEEFTYVASHDLRSPLRGIADLVTWIREDLGDIELPDDVKHNFDRISLRIDRAEQMIDDLLDYARAGVRERHTETIAPAELVEEALGLALVPDGFEVEIDLQGRDIVAPRAPLATSLRNLIGNAVKHHGGASGRIRIAMREEGRFSVFTVDDDGKGVTAGNEERIFKLFHRASPGTSGDGVGLAFTRRMINAHGGMVTVRSPGTLGGASFEIHWPRMVPKENEDD